MNEVREKSGYEITIFKPGTSSGEKTRSILFFVILSAVILVQACYWLFANQVHPIVLGMPFGMFFVVFMIVVEFLVLAVFYFTEKGDA